MADARIVSGFFPATVKEAYANQVAYCRANDSPVTARIVAAIAALFAEADPGMFITRIRDWQGSPLGDAVPLRSAGGLHALHLSGAAPELAPIYADLPADDAAIVGDAVRCHEHFLLPWLDGPPQDIWSVNLDGSGLARLTRLAEDQPSAAWSADGSQILAIAQGGLYQLDADGGGLTRLGEGYLHSELSWLDD